MRIDTDTMVSITEANQNYIQALRQKQLGYGLEKNHANIYRKGIFFLFAVKSSNVLIKKSSAEVKTERNGIRNGQSY